MKYCGLLAMICLLASQPVFAQTPPVITGLEIIPGARSVTFNWATSGPGNSEVKIGETILRDDKITTQHSIVAAHLAPDTEYQALITSSNGTKSFSSGGPIRTKTVNADLVAKCGKEWVEAIEEKFGPHDDDNPSGPVARLLAIRGLIEVRQEIAKIDRQLNDLEQIEAMAEKMRTYTSSNDSTETMPREVLDFMESTIRLVPEISDDDLLKMLEVQAIERQKQCRKSKADLEKKKQAFSEATQALTSQLR